MEELPGSIFGLVSMEYHERVRSNAPPHNDAHILFWAMIKVRNSAAGARLD